MRSVKRAPNRSMEALMRGTSAKSTPVPTIISDRSRRGDGQPAVLHALSADQYVGHFPYFRRLAFYHQHLQTIIVIEMHVQGGEDRMVVIVLDGRELLAELPHVMVVNQRHGADYLAVRRFPGLFHQFVANQVAKRLRPVGVAALPDEVVELVQQVAVDRYANSAKAAHC